MEEENKPKRNLKTDGTQECLLIQNEKEGTMIQLVSIHQTINELIQSAFVIKSNFFDSKEMNRSYIG